MSSACCAACGASCAAAAASCAACGAAVAAVAAASAATAAAAHHTGEEMAPVSPKRQAALFLIAGVFVVLGIAVVAWALLTQR